MSEQITAYFSNIANGVKSFITGLSLTLEHFKNKKDNVATLQYPHEKFPIPEKKIGFEQSEYNVIRSRLHVDIDDCISCRMCERACPVDCIKIEDVKAKKGVDFEYGQTSNETQKKLLVTRFTIDMSECMYCNLCVYPCPEECIYMVGGPNEEKHEIDYEFSQYKREGMIFDFAKAETEDLVKMGADDYLKTVKEKQENLLKGERLLGLEIEKVDEPAVISQPATSVVTPIAAPISGIDNLTIKCVDIIGDIKLRAAAKKVFFKSKKAGEDDITKVDKMITELKTVDGFTAELEQQLNALKPEPVAAVPVAAAPVGAVPAAVAPVDNLTIKCVDIIGDIKLRAAAKKVFFKSKKAGEDDITKVDKMITELKTVDGFTAELEQQLNALKPEPVAAVPVAAAPVGAVPAAVAPVDNLTIKCVDIIGDIKLRAAAKKVFFKSKKAGEDDITKVDKMITELKTVDGFTAELEQQLNALKPEPVAAAPVDLVQATNSTVEAKVIQGLFEIKILNDIEDIKTRAMLKKIYMGAKKSSKNSSDVIPEMIAFLEKENMITDQIKSLLEGILK